MSPVRMGDLLQFVSRSSDPAGVVGEAYWNSTDKALKVHDGTTWIAPGAGSFSWRTTGANMVVNTPTSATRAATSGAWDHQAYSLEGFRTAFCTFRASRLSIGVIAGLNSDPTTDASYLSIDFAIYPTDTNWQIYESGAWKQTFTETWDVNTVWAITYDGVHVRYFKDGVLKRTVLHTVGPPLHFDSSFYQEVTLFDVHFGPMGESAGLAALTVRNASAGSTSLPTSSGINGVVVKLPNINTVDVNTPAWWDATNLRYNPKVAGRYMCVATFVATVGGVNGQLCDLAILKNGARGFQNADGARQASSASWGPYLQASRQLVCNGTTDYIELFGAHSGVALAGNAVLDIAYIGSV